MRDWQRWGLVIAAVVVIYGGYRHWGLTQNLAGARTQIAELKGTLEQKGSELQTANDDIVRLTEAYENEKARMDELAEQVAEISDTTADLEKLSRLDPELLQKYSKIYFLNEHYIPSGLTDIGKEYLHNIAKPLQIHAKVERRLETMLDDAADDGVEINVVSAYRSFSTQSSLKAGYRVTYGSGANAFSADQGYSEHQLGTTVDLTSAAANGDPLAGFQSTPSYKWLQENAYRYGFVLSYPEGNSYYVFEPWHWRFVGRDLARYLHREGKNFYDVEQRVIDEYLLEFFD